MLAFYAFPAEQWPKLGSTNPHERVNREIGRRRVAARRHPRIERSASSDSISWQALAATQGVVSVGS